MARAQGPGYGQLLNDFNAHPERQSSDPALRQWQGASLIGRAEGGRQAMDDELELGSRVATGLASENKRSTAEPVVRERAGWAMDRSPGGIFYEPTPGFHGHGGEKGRS